MGWFFTSWGGSIRFDQRRLARRGLRDRVHPLHRDVGCTRALLRQCGSELLDKRILVLERGPFLPREKDNWNYHGSFKYYSSEVMFNKDGGEIRPGFSYFVGGNTKVYGAALFRLREKDFESFRHRDGISPEWPIKYRDWENYYTQAEELYQVHGKAGEDPTEPWRSKEYPHPPISHEPRIAEVFEILKARGLMMGPRR